MPEDIFHFVTMHHTHPFSPHIGTRSLREEVIVDLHATIREQLRKMRRWTDEIIIAHDVRYRLLILVAIVYPIPIGILENDGFSLNLRHILEDGIDDVEKFVSIEKTGLIFLEEVNKVVQNKVRPLINYEVSRRSPEIDDVCFHTLSISADEK